MWLRAIAIYGVRRGPSGENVGSLKGKGTMSIHMN